MNEKDIVSLIFCSDAYKVSCVSRSASISSNFAFLYPLHAKHALPVCVLLNFLSYLHGIDASF